MGDLESTSGTLPSGPRPVRTALDIIVLLERLRVYLHSF